MRNAPTFSNVIRLPQRPNSYPRRPLAPNRNAMTALALFKHGETEKALKVSDCNDESRAVWCPKAMLIVECEAPEGVIVAAMPQCVAEQKRLWPRFVDREGWSEAKIDALNEAEAFAARKRNRLRNYRPSSLGHFGRNQFA
ncbi:MAG: hypothetical protein ABFD89_18590 [Bryobacteraceae bacterium]